MTNKIIEGATLAALIVAFVATVLGYPYALLLVIPAVVGVLYMLGGPSVDGRVGFLFKVAVGRGYSALTPDKRQRLSDEGHAILEERDGTYVVIESETMRGAIITAGDLGQRRGAGSSLRRTG